MGERRPVCALDASLHGHAARTAQSRAQNLYQSQVRWPTQHPDSHRLPRSPGKTSAKTQLVTTPICRSKGGSLFVFNWTLESSECVWLLERVWLVTCAWFVWPWSSLLAERRPGETDRYNRLPPVTRLHRSPLDPAQQHRETNQSLNPSLSTVRLETGLYDSTGGTVPSLHYQ